MVQPKGVRVAVPPRQLEDRSGEVASLRAELASLKDEVGQQPFQVDLPKIGGFPHHALEVSVPAVLTTQRLASCMLHPRLGWSGLQGKTSDARAVNHTRKVAVLLSCES